MAGPGNPPPHAPLDLDHGTIAFGHITNAIANNTSFKKLADEIQSDKRVLSDRNKACGTFVASAFLGVFTFATLFVEILKQSTFGYVVASTVFGSHLGLLSMEIVTIYKGHSYQYISWIRIIHVTSYTLGPYLSEKWLSYVVITCCISDAISTWIRVRYGAIIPSAIKYAMNNISIKNPTYITSDRFGQMGIYNVADLLDVDFARLGGNMALNYFGDMASVSSAANNVKVDYFNEFNSTITELYRNYKKDNDYKIC